MLCKYVIGGYQLSNGYPPAYADYLSKAGIDLKTIFTEAYRAANSVTLERLQEFIVTNTVKNLVDQTYPLYVASKLVVLNDFNSAKVVEIFNEVVSTMVFYFHQDFIKIHEHIRSMIIHTCPENLLAQTLTSVVIKVFDVVEYGEDFIIHVSAT